MTIARVVGAELLDALAPDDPAALRSRRDLRRVHRAMGTRSLLRRDLTGLIIDADRSAPLRVLELGAGDGSLMLGLARSVASAWPPVELSLLDRQPLVSDETIAAYAALGWRAARRVDDVLDWAGPAAAEPGGRWDLIVANLFLHHFSSAQLVRLLGAVAARSNAFFACEPRRGWLALAGSHLVGALGANAVTREDAVLSVHAGFRDRELSALWPASSDGWQVREYAAGPFSHCLRATRTGAGAA